jgi:hypothetical protein
MRTNLPPNNTNSKNMFQPSLLLLLGFAIVRHAYAATSLQRKLNVPDLIWSDGESADEESACKEQSMSTIVEKKRQKTRLIGSNTLAFNIFFI